jgi:hypothetical protein
MELKLNLDSLKALEDDDIKVDAIKLQKMILLYNAIEKGWCIKKRNDSYVFSKFHEGKKEVLEESYLHKFMKSNLDINKILS